MEANDDVVVRASELARSLVTSLVEQIAVQGGDDLLRFVPGDTPSGPLVNWVTLLQDDLPQDPYFVPLAIANTAQIASVAILAFANAAEITREEALQKVISLFTPGGGGGVDPRG